MALARLLYLLSRKHVTLFLSLVVVYVSFIKIVSVHEKARMVCSRNAEWNVGICKLIKHSIYSYRRLDQFS